MRIAFLVTHLLGTGHLARTAQIADAFATRGHDALVLSGGMPAPLVAPKAAILQQIPPIRSDATFTTLFDENDKIASPAFFERRIVEIHNAIRAFRPDVLVTELFPFGRRKLAAEFEAAIHAAPDARIVSSIRDILQMPRKTGRKEEAEERLRRHYDGILFHGDSSLVGLDASWPLPAPLSALVEETGYITNAAPTAAEGTDGTGEIIVAAGGGAVGTALFNAALDAARQKPALKWRILIGKQTDIGHVPPSVIVQPVRPDFRALLTRCRLAVLQCGYNTAMDIADTGARAVFCPFEGEGETEQLQRAQAMAKEYGCGVIRENMLDGRGLLAEIDATLNRPAGDFTAIRRKGAQRSVDIVERALQT